MNGNEKIWRDLNFYQSAKTCQTYLKNCYVGLDHAELKSYDNCYPFMYYLEQGEIFFRQTTSSPLNIKPILLFYGLIHFIKACVLSIDSFYPNSTSVLAHGVTSRKKKKRHYQFIHDEVKIQRNGLFTHFAEQLFHMEHLEGEKFKMGDLLAIIPELDDIHLFIEGKANITLLEEYDHHWLVPADIMNGYFMDEKRLKSYLEEKSMSQIYWNNNTGDSLTIDKDKIISPPFRYHLWKQKVCLPNTISPINHFPDLLVYYLLLYNLSMISRYETEWWIELIKTTPSNDFPLIKTFLEITEKKVPYLILQFLNKQKTKGS